MKYKVSLLPERNRKRLNSKKKAEKVKVIALIALCIVFSTLVLTMGLKFYADDILAEEKAKNSEYDSMVQSLAEYRAINQQLQEKVNLINSIQVDEPSLYNFVASLSNIKHTDISVDAIDCQDWKASRSCVISGTFHSMDAFDLYKAEIEKIEGVSSVMCNQLSTGIVDGVMNYQFVLFVSCSGGKAPSAVNADTVEQ